MEENNIKELKQDIIRELKQEQNFLFKIWETLEKIENSLKEIKEGMKR